MHVRHYYSIANFLMGVGTKIYDNYFSSYYDQTYQQLFGQFTAIAKGQVAANAEQGIIPQNLINQWGNNLAQQVATEWKHFVWNLEHSPRWDGGASPMIHTSLWNFMSEWSTVTTIAAGVIDEISQQIRDATSILELERILPAIGLGASLVWLGTPENGVVVNGSVAIIGSIAISLALINPFLGVEKINLMYQVGFDFSKLSGNDTRNLVKELGIENLKPLKEVGVDFAKLTGWVIKEFGLESIKPLKDAGVDFSKLTGWVIKELVKELGIEGLKAVKEVGVDFAKLDGLKIMYLVKELGIESLKAVKEVGVDFAKLDGLKIMYLVKELGIESLKAVKEVGVDYSKLDIWEIGTLVKELGIDIEITEFYKIIDHMTIPHDIIERHIGDSKVEQDTISVIIKEVEVNNLQGIVTELNPSSWGEDFAITT